MSTLDAASAAPTATPDDPTIWEVDDALWADLQPVLVIAKPRLKPGRPRADDRRIFNGLVWLARTGSQWKQLPARFGPKSTAHDRLTEWADHGCLATAWALLLSRYDATIGLEWEWQAADGCIVKAPLGKRGDPGEAEATGRNPTDRGKCGSKRHLLTDGHGVPLALVLSGANRTDMKKLEDLLEARLIAAPAEGARQLCLDRGYDYAACRETAAAHGYTPHIPPKTSAAQPLPPPGHPDRHPPRRWVVEVSHSWFNRFRRLLIRWDKLADHYLAFAQLAACLIIYRKIRHARVLSG